jgi:transcriptional regulator with PAS, ATPase and Fis domain
VRELENEMERALVLTGAGETIDVTTLSERMQDGVGKRRRRSGSLQDAVTELEGEMIEEAMGTFDGNKTKMSQHLGISRWTLLQKMREHGLEPTE